MPSNFNTLAIAWAVTLILLIGGIAALEMSYVPAVNETAETEDDSDDQGAEDGAEDGAENGAEDGHTDTDDHNGHTNDGGAATNAGDAQPQATAGNGDSSSGAPTPVTTTPRPNGPSAPNRPADRPRSAASGINPPIAELLEQSRHGALPRIASDGTRPADYYAGPSPVPASSERPRIAILVNEMGMQSRNTRRAINDLPAAVSLGFSPYSIATIDWPSEVRAKNHEFYLMLPMEPVNIAQNDPGPLGLLTDYSAAQNVDLLQSTLGQMQGYVGVVTHMGSRFTAASDSLRPVLIEIEKRGLIFVDGRSTPYTRAASMAQTLGMSVASNDRYVDNDVVEAEIIRQLGELETRARTLGAAMGLARPYPVSVRAVARWAEGLEARGFDLVPVSDIVGRQAIR